MWLKFYVYQSPEEGAEAGSASGGSAPAEELEGDSSSSDSSVNWAGLADSFDEPDVEGDLEVLGEGSPTQSPEPAPVPTAPPTQAAPAPAAAPSSPAAPVAAPTAPAQSAPPPPPTSAPSQPGTATPQEYQGWREARVSELEKHYTLSEDESAALLTEPELVLPKLAAKVHMEVLENSMRAMQAMVPIMMQQVQQHGEIQTRARGLFASINPDLADPGYEPVILQLGTTFRQMNPTAGPEEASRAIGNLVRAALNMQAPQVQQGLPQANAPAPAPVPFTPVRGGGGGQRPVTSGNQFEQLASELLDDEDNW